MDIFGEITKRIISEMEQGIIPWHKPWIGSGTAVSHTTGKPYSLLNQILLGHPGEYITFKQVQAEGGKVKKGEKSRMVVFWKFIDQEDKETGEVNQVPFLKYYNVFHIDQCEGIAAKHSLAPMQLATANNTADKIIKNYVENTGIHMENREGDAAYYQPSTDSIVLPLLKQFTETAEYYGTVFHEMIHSTGHVSRLNRLDDTAFFGSDNYSKEELVAEIGSAALVHHAGLETAGSFRNSTAYIQSWLSVLKNDKRFIVSAANKAEKAVNYILVEH